MTKKLGNTKIEIPSIGIGTMGIGGYFTKDTSKDDYYIDIIRKSIDLGMTFIDTAEIYGCGYSEILVGNAIKDCYCRENIFIATKVSPEHLNYDNVIKSAENSCLRLQTSYIDLYQIHWPNPTIPLKETLSGIRYLMNKEKIKYFGVCNFSLQELVSVRKLARELDINVVSNQIEYNLFDRCIEKDILPYCEKEKVTIIAYSPLDKGNIGCYYELENIAKKYNKTIAQIILRWLIRHDSVVVIPKATNMEHIRYNASSDFIMSLEDIEFIDRNFNSNCIEIPIEKILVNTEGLDKFVPKPEDLAKSIKYEGVELKPIRVRRITRNSEAFGEFNNYDYQLVEGKVRYWAWVYAHGGSIHDYINKKIPPIRSLIRG